MTTNSPTIEILDPRLELVPEEIGISSDLPSLKGKVIGLLENRKYHADVFLEELEQVLTTDYQADKIVYRNKFSFSAACSDETINELTEQCDAIIHAIAD